MYVVVQTSEVPDGVSRARFQSRGNAVHVAEEMNKGYQRRLDWDIVTDPLGAYPWSIIDYQEPLYNEHGEICP